MPQPRASATRAFGATALVLIALTNVTTDGVQRQRPRRFLVPPQELGLLESPDRDAWQRPDEIMDALGIADGSTVADLRAERGWFTVRLARRVGPNGRVYAEDARPHMIEAIERRIVQEGLRNVQTILTDRGRTQLPVGQLDAALLVNAYGSLTTPISTLRRVASALTPRGRLGIIDFTGSGGGPGPPQRDRVDPTGIVREAQAAGLRLRGREEFLPYQYLLVFGR